MAIAFASFPAVGDDATASWANQVASDVNIELGGTFFAGVDNAVQAIANATDTAFLLQTEQVDTYGGHSTVTNTNQYVVPAACNGWRIEVFGTCQFAANATGGRRLLVHKNTVTIAAATCGSAGSTFGTSLQIRTSFIAATGDVIEIFGQQVSGGSLNTVGGNQSMELRFAGLT